MKQYPNPATMHVEVPDPEDLFAPPIYEGPANEAHRKLSSGQYKATVQDPWDADRDHDVTLHVWNPDDGSGVGNSSVYNLPDHMREHPWDLNFSKKVARIMTEIFGFESTTNEHGESGVEFTIGDIQFSIGENVAPSTQNGPHTFAYAQDLSDRDETGFPRVVDTAEIPDEDISYRGSWSPWETARQFVRYAVPSFGKIAEKRAANADHVL